MSGDHNEHQKDKSYLDFECPRCGHCCYVDDDDTSQKRVDETAKDRLDREEIIRMAREAGFDPHDMSDDFTCNLEDIERFAALVASAEREACARFIEDEYLRQFVRPWREDLAAAIRARGEQ